MSYNDLIIKDLEFQDASDHFEAFHNTLLNAIQQYKAILAKVSTNAIASGKTHDALVAYTAYVYRLEVIVEALSGQYKTIVDNYIEEIENADDYLYDADISHDVRDFTQEVYDKLIACLRDPWSEITDSIGDFLYDKLMAVLDFFDLDTIKASLNRCHVFLLDYNDETRQGLKLMFDAVHAIDREYGESVSSGYGSACYITSAFSSIVMTLLDIESMLEEMSLIINPGCGSFTVQTVERRLGRAYQELWASFEKVNLIVRMYDPPTQEEIAAFASLRWAGSVFNDFGFELSDFLAGVDGLDTFLMVLANMFDINKDILLSSREWRMMLEGNPIPFYEYLRNVMNGDVYDVMLKRKQILLVLQEMSDNYTYSGSDEEELVDKFSTILKYSKKYEKNWYKKLVEDIKKGSSELKGMKLSELQQMKEFLDGLGNAQEILKYGSKGIELLSRLFTDYSAGLEVIESLERSFSGDENFQKALCQVRDLYDKEILAWVGEIRDTVMEFGVDEAFKILAKEVPVAAVISAIEETIDVTGEISGLGTKAKKMYEVMTQVSFYSTSQAAYRAALAKVRETSPGTDAYAQALEDLENCFNLHKQNTVELYKNMEEASSGERAAYYRYCSKQAEQLSMKSQSEPKLMTFDEFCAMSA